MEAAITAQEKLFLHKRSKFALNQWEITYKAQFGKLFTIKRKTLLEYYSENPNKVKIYVVVICFNV